MTIIKKLNPSSQFPKPEGPVLLIIMDGVGIAPAGPGNAVHVADTPILDKLMQQSLYTELKAHGTAVGMPSDADMGNSEVGHNALGAGQIFDQGASLVQRAIDSGQIFKGKTWKLLIDNVKIHQSSLHFIGLLSDGNVHSHINHLLAMLARADEEGVESVRCHILLDGRDVGERTALGYVDQLENELSRINQQDKRDYRIASGGGRMLITMDRYHAEWDMVERGWRTHVQGNADRRFSSARAAIETFYNENATLIDQYLPPFVITEDDHAVGPIVDTDSVICTNFRGDRAIELTQAFEQIEDFEYFDRGHTPNVAYAGMMQYDGDLHLPKHFLVDPPLIEGALSEFTCAERLKSFAISETQKYGHVTYFWNGNKSGYIDESLETYVEIPSDLIPFEDQPYMKAIEITDKSVELLKSGDYQFGRINFPNGDMIGHTGVMEAAVKGVEITDVCVGRLLDIMEELNGITVILADHGNADEMFVEKNGIRVTKTSHTLNPVPCAIVGKGLDGKIKMAEVDTPGLANVAATLCNLLGYDAPDHFEPSLIEAV